MSSHQFQGRGVDSDKVVFVCLRVGYLQSDLHWPSLGQTTTRVLVRFHMRTILLNDVKVIPLI